MTNETGTLPLGLSMALAQDEAAMTAFGQLTDAQRQSWIDRAREVSSHEEMEALVRALR